MNIDDASKHFCFDGEFVCAMLYGSGHINQTFCVQYSKNNKIQKYIVQKINNKIFPNVEGLMANIEGVCNFVRKEVQSLGGNPDVESLTIVYTRDGKSFFDDNDGGFWRAYLFIEEGIGFDKITSPEQFYQSGKAFGKFQKLLQKYPAESLFDVIPNFHNTRCRFESFKQSISKNEAGRVNLVQEEINFFIKREKYADKIVNLLKNGKMPLRVTHNDTKLNNVLIDPNTCKAVCVIDLDTIMKGSIVYDFGDSIRFGATTAAEDEKDIQKVNFDINLFEVYAEGFLNQVADYLNDCEIENLAFGAILMTYECGMRFLTDYLNGDKYFRVNRECHNIDRARTQIKLVSDMENVFDKTNSIVKKIAKKSK